MCWAVSAAERKAIPYCVKRMVTGGNVMGLEIILNTVGDFIKVLVKATWVVVVLALGAVASIAYLIGYLTR